jgi:hypothetical protein
MIQNIKKTSNHFYIGNDIKSACAMILFSYDNDDTIIIDHTYVSSSLRGRGIGKKLVHEVICFAQKEHLKVLPLCNFANSIMTNTDAYMDVLEK